MGRDTKAELQKCLRHNTALMATVEAQDMEIERMSRALKGIAAHTISRHPSIVASEGLGWSKPGTRQHTLKEP